MWCSNKCTTDMYISCPTHCIHDTHPHCRRPIKEREHLRFLANCECAATLVVGHEAVGVDDGGPALALADMAAEGERLAEGEPALAGKAVLDDGVPEDEDIDPGIGAAGGGVLRNPKRCRDGARVPRLDPGQPTRLQFGNDTASDLVRSEEHTSELQS